MDEDPKQHDFDQRHDGPFDPPTGRPSIQIDNARPSLQLEPVRQVSSKSAPANVDRAPISAPGGSVSSPAGEKPRKSVQLPRQDSEPAGHPPRKSTQLSMRGAGRPSRDFDVRRDGPYGRPSLTMTRRRSSALGALDHTETPVEPTAPSVEALEAYMSEHEPERPAFEPEPPPLNYSLWDRKWYIAFFWSMILIDCIAAPIILYFCLWYLTDLSPNAVFSIVTAALGGVSILEYILRFWKLWKKGSTCRVIGARRAYLDWFHWNFSFGWIIVIVELIVGTIPEHPPIRLLSMPLASMLYAFGTELIIVDTLRVFHVPAPVRISSIPKGAQLRPAIYSMIEDIVAVDGSGGTEYREALNRRYEASHVFRAMLRRLGVFWAVGAEGMAVVTTILVFTIQHEAAFVVGWSAPFVWAGVWVIITFIYVKSMLKKEKVAWAEELAEKQGIALSERTGTGSPTNGDKSREEVLQDENGNQTAAVNGTGEASSNTQAPTPAALEEGRPGAQ